MPAHRVTQSAVYMITHGAERHYSIYTHCTRNIDRGEKTRLISILVCFTNNLWDYHFLSLSGRADRIYRLEGGPLNSPGYAFRVVSVQPNLRSLTHSLALIICCTRSLNGNLMGHQEAEAGPGRGELFWPTSSRFSSSPSIINFTCERVLEKLHTHE